MDVKENINFYWGCSMEIANFGIESSNLDNYSQ
jgi:hypothetical protein